tara:strand:- start:308 stop:1006 length:699 start_codon:yes stop_codon:yes gene_type:complete
MNKNESFIDQVITNMSEKKNRNGAIARLVDSADHELAANRIAVVWDNLGDKRAAAKVEAVRSGNPAPEMLEKPEHILPFIQQVMNTSCWAARRVIGSGKQTDLANGLDFSQSVAEQAGNIASSRIIDVEATLMDDYDILNELHSWLCSEMNYMTDLDPLFLFSEKVCIDEEQNIWEHTHMCMDINDVLPILDEKFLEISAEAAAKKKTHAATHIFGAKQKSVTKIKPAKKAA